MTAEVHEPVVERRRSVLGPWDSAVTSYYLLAGATAMLVAIGLVMVLSSSTVYSLSKGGSAYAVFLDQARFALIGLPLAWVASRLPLTFYKKIAWPALLVALVLQTLVLLIGIEVNGNKAWLRIAGQQFQPAEIGKLALAVWLGLVLARKRALLGRWLHVLVPGVLGAGALLGLVLLGHDLGTGIVLALLAGGAFFVAGVPLRMFAVAAVVGVPLLVVLAQASDSRVRRITVFFSGEECDALGACLQTTRGLYGLGSGGLTGVGLGESSEKWSYLPEAHNDFVFAVLGEELGLLGTLLVLALLGVLAVAMSRVIRRHPDPFVQVTTAAIAAWILGQALINIAVVVGLLPVVGLPLPLVSAGGSALVVTMVALGVVLSFARTEPGAAEALQARPTVVRRSLAVVGRAAGRGRRA